MGKAQKLIESVIDDGRLPADLIRDMIYGKDSKHPLHSSQYSRANAIDEETGGDVSIPENPGEDEPAIASPDGDEADDNALYISLDTPEDQAEWDDLTRALSAAGVNFTIERTNDGETVIGWPSNEADAINNILKGLGYSVDDDETPEATFDYYEP